MLALVFDGQATLRTNYPIPKPTADEALVAVHLAGICRTDLEILKGYMHFRGVMGHEFVGTVVKGPRRWQKRRVVAEINCFCGQCDLCTSGLSNHCRNRTVLGMQDRDGVFAEYVAVPIRNLHEVPTCLSDEEAVFVEPLAAAFQVTRQVPISQSDEVVILGDGRLGQLVARVLKTRAGKLMLVGKHQAKLEAAEKQGIRTVLVEEFSLDHRADVVVEATGRAEGFALAMQTVRPRGTIVLKSTFSTTGLQPFQMTPLVVDEITVVGSRCGPFPEALTALAADGPEKIDVAAMFTRRFSLRQGLEALGAAGEPENLKVILDVAS